MDVVLAVGAVQAVFFAVLLFNKQVKALADKILGFWLIIISVHLFINYLEVKGYYSQYPHLIGSTSSLVFLYGPLLFIYIHTTINQSRKIASRLWLHFIPFVLYNLALLPFYLQSGADKLDYSENLWQQGTEILEGILLVVKALFGPIYIVLSLRLLNQHQNNLNQQFSDHDDIDLKWLRYLIWSMAVVLLIFFSLTLLKVNVPSFGMKDTEVFIFVAMSIWILALGYYGIKQTPIFVPGVETLEASAPKSAPNRKPEALSFDEKDKRKLVEVLEQDKIYLKSKLTLQDLAIEVDVPAHQLSQLINREFGQNFFELINKYRVEEVKRKLKDPKFQHLTFLGIALESGFNSKASFNRIFKKSTGQTPNEYRKQVA